MRVYMLWCLETPAGSQAAALCLGHVQPNSRLSAPEGWGVRAPQVHAETLQVSEDRKARHLV